MTNKWQNIKLGEVCTLIKGVTYKSDDYTTSEDGLVFLTLKSIAKGGGFNFDGVKYYKGTTNPDQFVKPNDLIIANTDLTRAGDVIGAPLFVPKIDNQDQYVFSMDITRIVTDESKLNRNFLYYYLLTNNVRNYMRGISNGSTVLHLKVRLINDLDIPLPPLNIQTRIAQSLSKLDAQIRNTDQIIQKTEVLKQGVMQDLFAKKNSFWKNQKLGEITNFIDYRGKTPKKSASGIPLITAKNVRMGFIDPEPREFIHAVNYDSWMTRGIPNKGDVLFTTEAPLGNIAQLETNERVAFAQRVIIIQPRSGLDSSFLKYLLMSTEFQGKIGSLGTGGTVKGIKAKVLKQINIPIPPFEEQIKISSILSLIDLKVEKEKENRKLFFTLKNGLMQDIFSQKVQIN